MSAAEKVFFVILRDHQKDNLKILSKTVEKNIIRCDNVSVLVY
jgi:hypothetical protein